MNKVFNANWCVLFDFNIASRLACLCLQIACLCLGILNCG